MWRFTCKHKLRWLLCSVGFVSLLYAGQTLQNTMKGFLPTSSSRHVGVVLSLRVPSAFHSCIGISLICSSVLEYLPIAFLVICLLSFPFHVATCLLYLVYFCWGSSNGLSGVEKTPFLWLSPVNSNWLGRWPRSQLVRP